MGAYYGTFCGHGPLRLSVILYTENIKHMSSRQFVSLMLIQYSLFCLLTH